MTKRYKQQPDTRLKSNKWPLTNEIKNNNDHKTCLFSDLSVTSKDPYRRVSPSQLQQVRNHYIWTHTYLSTENIDTQKCLVSSPEARFWTLNRYVCMSYYNNFASQGGDRNCLKYNFDTRFRQRPCWHGQAPFAVLCDRPRLTFYQLHQFLMRLTDSPHDDTNHRQMALRSEIRSVLDSIVKYCDMSQSLFSRMEPWIHFQGQTIKVYKRYLVWNLGNIGRIVKLRSRSQVRSRSGPRSGPKGPRTKDQRPGPGLYTKFGLPPTTTTTSKLFLGG